MRGLTSLDPLPLSVLSSSSFRIVFVVFRGEVEHHERATGKRGGGTEGGEGGKGAGKKTPKRDDAGKRNGEDEAAGSEEEETSNEGKMEESLKAL